MTRNKNFQIEKKWTVKPEADHKIKIGEVSEVVTDILAKRGFNKEKAFDFLFPEYGQLSDPFALQDMERAVEVILSSIKKGEPVAVYGDYDVDGISGTAILVRFFSLIGIEVLPYIPSREGEGYGLNKKAIDELAKKGIKLVITTDCGTSAEEEIRYCHEKGMKIVVTDHHEPKVLKETPEALVNPKTQPGNKFTNLAGAGVAFYLVRALQSRMTEKFPRGQEKWLLDLVALGTICDIVPLVDDNRILAKYGLMVAAKSRNTGLRALAKISGFELETIDTYRVGFLLGPRLNAAGRLEHANKSLELLLTDDPTKADENAAELNELNEARQEITERIVAEAKKAIEAQDAERKIFLLADKDWPAGVVGIAASRLVEEYGRPVLIMEDTGEFLKGSARSIKGFNIVKALSACQECLTQFGGHAAAAGFTLEKDRFLLLDEKLVAISDKEITTTELIPEIVAEKVIIPEKVDLKLAQDLRLLEPFGPENPKPVFVIQDVTVGRIQQVGKDKTHLKLNLADKGYEFSGIAFNYGEECILNTGEKISLAGTLEVNEWKGKKSVDLHVIDIKLNKKVDQNVNRTAVNKS